jgi:hypothetical protein
VSESRPRAIELIGAKKAKAVSILFMRLHQTGSDVFGRLKRFNDDFTESQLMELRAHAPTAEDYGAIDAYNGDPSLLGRSEVFFLEIRPMELFVPHLDFLLLRGIAPPALEEVHDQSKRVLDSL